METWNCRRTWTFYWSDTWLMKFQPTKCKVLPLGHWQEHKIPNLSLYSRKEDGSMKKVQLEQTDQKLSSPKQIINKINKANSTMGIIRRTFDYLDRKIFTQLYKNLIQTYLEVSNSAWVLYKKQDIELIEAVQIRATRQIPGYSQMDYEQRLRLLGLPTLTFRRLRGNMIETYKILSRVYDKGTKGISANQGDIGYQGHSNKIFKRSNRLNIMEILLHYQSSHHLEWAPRINNQCQEYPSLKKCARQALEG